MKFKTVILASVICFAFQSVIGQQQSAGDKEYQLYLTQIAAAEAFFHLNEISTANFYLNACDETYRNLEWRFLRSALDQSEMSLASPENHYYTDVKISPNGKLAAVASTDSVITLFDYPELKKIGELKGHRSSVSTLSFNNDGKKLVSGGRDHAVIVWDIATGKQLAANDTSFTQGIYQVRFSPNDSLIGVVSWERIANRQPGVFGFAKLLDANTGKELFRIELDNHPAAGIVFPDNKNIILSTWGEIVYSCNIQKKDFNWKFDLSDYQEYNAFHSIDIHPDGKTVVVGSTDHRVYILNCSTGEVVQRIEPWNGHSKIVKAVNFSEDGNFLATAGEDQTILIWNTADYSKKFSLVGHTNTVSGLAWKANGNSLLSSSLDGSLKKWNLQQPFETSYEICDFGPWQTPFTIDNKYFAAPASDKKLTVYEAATGKPLINYGEQSGLCADISEDSKLLATASFDGIVRLWDMEAGKEIQAFQGHTGRVDGIAFINSTNQVVSVGDTTLRVWNIKEEKETRIVPFNRSPFRIAVTPDESKIIVAFGNGLVKIFNPVNWLETASFNCSNGIQEITVNPDGNTLAVFAGKDVELWNLETNNRMTILKGHQKSGYGLGFSPDGKYLISGSYDQTFKLWNLETNSCSLTFHDYDDAIYGCKILSGNQLFLSSPQGIIRYYQF